MIPIWLMIAQGVKKVADNQNKQIDDFNKNQQYTIGVSNDTTPNGQPMNNVNTNRSGLVQTMTGNSGGGLGNAFSTFSSIYGNYLNDEKKKKLFQQ